MKKCILIVKLICFSIGSFASPGIHPVGLTCGYLKDPLAINSAKPNLSWKLTGAGYNETQYAYEIIVGNSKKAISNKQGNCWSTGKIISDETLNITYAGQPLTSLTQYFWRVKVYDKNGVSIWSDVAQFETAMLQQTDWKASWINDGGVNPADDADYYKDNRMPLLKKDFIADKKIIAARLYITGVGYYEAYLNGKKIGHHMLDPGFTTYEKQVQYVAYDVTGIVKKGANTAGIMLGSGWWDPLPFKFFGRWRLRDYQQTGRPCARAELHLKYSDGSSAKIITDQTWQWLPGPITHNNVYLGETYDARLEQKWGSGNWQKVTLATGPEGVLTAQQQPPVKVTAVVIPVNITQQGRDTFIADMGKNFAGVARIKVQGRAGTKISLRYGEALWPDGSLNYMTTVATQIKKGGINGGPGAPATAWQQDDYILKGDGIEEWSPRFTFHGFRFVEIIGWPGKPTVNDIQGLIMNSSLTDDGSFACSNSMFNQLDTVIRRTFLSNVFSVQSDCPGREKMGYGGDMVATANAFMYNFNMATFYTKTVNDFANEQRAGGGITEIAPFTGIADRGYGDLSGPLGWQLAFPFLQKQLYDFYGDKQIIQNNYAAFKKQIAFLESKAVDHLFYWDISDHEALDTKPEALTASCFYYHHLLLAATFAGILQQHSDSTRFAALAATVKDAIIQKYLVKGTGRFDNATQSAQIFALWYAISPEKEKSIQVFMNELRRHNGHLATGIFSTKMMFDVLRENDLNDTAYNIVNQLTYPGWGYMLQQGATTLWETWQYPESGPSQNHPMFGSVAEWFYRSLLGINPGLPGFKKIIIKPQPAGDLTWAKGNYQSVRGNISSAWSKTGGRFELHVSIPVNTVAEIWVPAPRDANITENGKVLQQLSYSNGYFITNIGSGNYNFVVE